MCCHLRYAVWNTGDRVYACMYVLIGWIDRVYVGVVTLDMLFGTLVPMQGLLSGQ